MDNDGRFPEETPVEVRYPLAEEQEAGPREEWPWLPGTVAQQVGPEEWQVIIEVRELAVPGRDFPYGAQIPDDELVYPMCYRSADELRKRVHH